MSSVAPPPSEGPVPGEDPPAVGLDGEAETTPPTEFELALADRDEWRDRAQRIPADLDNCRRRMVTQRADDIDTATVRLAGALPSRLFWFTCSE